MNQDLHTNEFVEKDIEFWLQIRRESKIQGASFVDDAAKQIIGITSLLQGIYFAAISISDIKKVGNVSDLWFVIFIVCSCITILFWFLSLFFAVRAFLPKKYDLQKDADKTEYSELANYMAEAYTSVLKFKQGNLRTSTVFLWLSFIPLAINMIVYLIFSPIPPTP